MDLPMKKHVVVADLNDLAKQELYAMIDKLEDYAKSLTQDEQMNAFWVHENDPFHYTAGDGNTFSQHVVEDKTWDKIEDEIDGLSTFIQKFNLTNGVVVVSSGAVPAHKHNGGPTAKWSLTAMKNACDGTVKFYYEKEDRVYDPDAFIFDPDNELIFAEQDRTSRDGIYSFNTDIYHSWHPDSYETRNELVYVFYLKNTVTIDDVRQAINNINKSYS